MVEVVAFALRLLAERLSLDKVEVKFSIAKYKFSIFERELQKNIQGGKKR